MKIVHICLSGLYMSGWGYQDNMLAKYHKRAGHQVSVIANSYVYDEKGNYVRIEDAWQKISLEVEKDQLVNKDCKDNKDNNAKTFSTLKEVDGKPYKYQETDCNGVVIYRLGQVGNKMVTGPAQRVHYSGLYETLNEIKPDIIFLHNPQILDVEDIVRYMKEASVKLFVDSHSDYSNSARNFLSKHILHGILWRSKIKKLIPYTSKFYGVLPARVDFLLERYKTPKDKTELLCMGMDIELAEKASLAETITGVREKLKVNKNDFLIITGGKIDSAKRQTLLLIDAVKEIVAEASKTSETINGNADATKTSETIKGNAEASKTSEAIKGNAEASKTSAVMRDNVFNIKLVIFGSVVDEMKEEFNKKIEECENINYIGWLDADSTYPYFAASDFAIFPGRHSVMWEQVAGQGIPMAVKYWAGTTHVDLGGNVEFLYKDSADEIKDLILSVMDRGEKYQKMKVTAKKLGPENFSYERIAKGCILS